MYQLRYIKQGDNIKKQNLTYSPFRVIKATTNVFIILVNMVI